MIELEEIIERAAKAAHQVNKAFCEACGDMSQSDWDEAEDWQKDSSRDNVRLLMEDPNVPHAKRSHENWVKDKLGHGWTLGPMKDAEKKEHPCLVPYEELPDEQKAKDVLFGTIARAVLAKYGVIPWEAI